MSILSASAIAAIQRAGKTLLTDTANIKTPSTRVWDADTQKHEQQYTILTNLPCSAEPIGQDDDSSGGVAMSTERTIFTFESTVEVAAKSVIIWDGREWTVIRLLTGRSDPNIFISVEAGAA